MHIVTLALLLIPNRLKKNSKKVDCFTITRNGIRHEEKPVDSIPYDPSTFRNCQVFVGDYENPVSFDLDSIEDKIEGKNTIVSEKYQMFMAQHSMQDVLTSVSGINDKLLYAIVGSLAINIITLIAVIAVLAQ